MQGVAWFFVLHRPNMKKQFDILIVDDEPEIGLLLSAMLKDMGHAVKVSANLYEARQVLNGFCPDVVLLDLNLPDGSGFSFLPVVRELHPLAKVIICSAYDGPAERKRAEISGAETFLGKPFTSEQLEKALMQL